ncbi:MAG: hypothetical protein JJT94_05150 [Bernardetiaceae bacterium]|nr:hypothetical protein [Bernardetiaceae bacterium]
MSKKKKYVKTTSEVLVIRQKKAKLSKAQSTYNRYIKQIDKLKEEIKSAEHSLEYIKNNINDKVYTHLDDLQRVRIEQLELMNAYRNKKAFRKYEDQINKLYFSTVSLILDEHLLYKMDDDIVEKIIALHDDYADMSYEELMQMQKEAVKGEFENLFEEMGLDAEETADIDFTDLNSAFQEALKRSLGKAIDEQQQSEQQKAAKDESFAQKVQGKKAKEDLRTQTVRSIYKRLAKALHPDLESDIEEQARKNELMQRVTAAYENDDFFELLRLQIEFKTQGKEDIAALADNEVGMYNDVLKSQIQELKIQLNTLVEFPIYEYFGGTRQRTAQVFRRCRERITEEILKCRHENLVIYAKEKSFLKYLKDGGGRNESEIALANLADNLDGISISDLMQMISVDHLDSSADKDAYLEKMDFLYGNINPFAFLDNLSRDY